MNFLSNPRFWVRAVVVVAALLLVQQIWHWEVERIEIPPGKFLVRVHRWGKDLPEGAILAPSDSYKGVMLEVLPEGRHFLNPIFWEHPRLEDIIRVPPGKAL